MIEIKHEVINQIPVIEMYEKGQADTELPTIFFYHGWESKKERVLEYGYVLAQKGFRAILPEALDHGERRQTEQATQDPMNFWAVVGQNVRELPQLVQYYAEHNKINTESIGVGGLSMGGVTTSAMLTQYEWINTAVVLMGSPAPITFTEWLLTNYNVGGASVAESLDDDLVQERLEELKPISLNLQPEKINNRSIYFWHGTADPIVPMHITEHFINEIKEQHYAQNLSFEKTEGIGHEVPQVIIKRTADFFAKSLLE